jgi:hypothetical protein
MNYIETISDNIDFFESIKGLYNENQLKELFNIRLNGILPSIKNGYINYLYKIPTNLHIHLKDFDKYFYPPKLLDYSILPEVNNILVKIFENYSQLETININNFNLNIVY